MNNLILRNALRFAGLVLLQVLIFNNIQIFAYITPFVYILFIILLPFETPRWVTLTSSFALGYTIDIFCGTGGIHAASCTLAGFLRPWIQNLVPSKQEYEPGIEPGIRNLGFTWFFLFSLLLTTVHHLTLFYLEIFSFAHFWLTLRNAMLNIVFTMVFILIIQYLFFRKN